MAAPARTPRGVLLTLLALLALLPARLPAEGQEEARISSGVRLFRALLAADTELASKTVEEGRLLVVFFYTDDKRRAEELARSFVEKEKAVRGLATLVETGSDPRFAAYDRRVPAGIFLAQSPGAQALRKIIDYGIERRVIVYSPFEGHVESGVLGGLAVEAQVRPYVNFSTLQASRIVLKEIFLKVTKVYR